jgi:hypothetical protein
MQAVEATLISAAQREQRKVLSLPITRSPDHSDSLALHPYILWLDMAIISWHHRDEQKEK